MSSDKEVKLAKLCIATCTRGRPEMLLRMLSSFENLHQPVEVELIALVVENDKVSSLRDIVTEKSTQLEFPVHYYWENRLGIPIARNRCLHEAKALGATHVIFIDDKERAHENWVTEYWQFAKACKKNGKGEVFIEGKVQSIMPDGIPRYMCEFFQREVRPTGATILTCTTANVWMPLRLVEQYALSFDESDPFAGGTDTKLFSQAKQCGMSLFYCAEALVYEEIPAERFNWRWLAKRRFRCGATDGELQVFDRNHPRVAYIVKRALAVLSNALKCLVYGLLLQRKKSLKYYLKSYRKAGELMGAKGHRVQSYQSVDGN